MWEEAVTAFREPMDGLKWVWKTLNEQGHLLQSAQALPFATQFLKYPCFQGIVCTPYPHQESVVVLGQKNTTEPLWRIEAGFMAQIEYILAQPATTRRIQGEY